jgi:hypothetical protein
VELQRDVREHDYEDEEVKCIDRPAKETSEDNVIGSGGALHETLPLEYLQQHGRFGLHCHRDGTPVIRSPQGRMHTGQYKSRLLRFCEFLRVHGSNRNY